MSEQLKYTHAERETLVLLHKVLEKLATNPKEVEEHRQAVEVYENGYTGAYHLVSTVYPEEIPKEVCDFVTEIAEMFLLIRDSIRELPTEDSLSEDEESDLSFHGFDGNEETEYKIYMRYLAGSNPDYYGELLNKEKNPHLWDAGNSHKSMVSSYRSLLANCRNLKKQPAVEYPFTAEQLRTLLK